MLRVPYTDQVLRGLALGIYHALQIPPCSTLKVTLGLSFVFTPCTLKFFSVVNAPTTTTTYCSHFSGSAPASSPSACIYVTLRCLPRSLSVLSVGLVQTLVPDPSLEVGICYLVLCTEPWERMEGGDTECIWAGWASHLLEQPLQVGKARPVSRMGGPAAQSKGIESPGAERRPRQPGSVLLQTLQDEVRWNPGPGLLAPGEHLPQRHPKHPHVRGRREGALAQALWSTPAEMELKGAAGMPLGAPACL